MLAAYLLAPALLTAAPATAASPLVIPTRFEAGHFYAVPQTTDGQRLRLLVDTGGGGGSGLFWITGAAARRLQLKTHICELDGARLTVAPSPHYRPDKSLPHPVSSPCGDVVMVLAHAPVSDGDGQLGAGFLPGRIWTFDYPRQQLLLQDGAWQPRSTAHALPMGFPRDAKGRPTSGFPRITIHVDGQPLDMLLDTGATGHPTAAARKINGSPVVNGQGVTSYITSGMLERWHRRHPDWRVIEQGDDLFPQHPARLIEVPRVELAGWSVGPVWFTERPDPAFHQRMAQWMDKPTEGAVGGNLLGHFVLTLDYPDATAYLSCEDGCKQP